MAALTVQNLPDGCAPRRWSVKSLPSRLRLSRARRRSLAQIQAPQSGTYPVLLWPICGLTWRHFPRVSAQACGQTHLAGQGFEIEFGFSIHMVTDTRHRLYQGHIACPLSILGIRLTATKRCAI